MNKLCLVILDGYGVEKTFDGSERTAFLGSLITSEKQPKENVDIIKSPIGETFDAVSMATNDNFRKLFDTSPYTLLNASSNFVGLPYGQMGNSEVGHLNIGAGIVVKQDLIRINDDIKSGAFASKLDKIQIAENKKIHLISLVSNGCVHSNIEHLFATIDYYKDKNVKVVIHFISDGRDTSTNSAIDFAKQLQEKINSNCNFVIGSLSGRYFAMDREKNLDRTQKYFSTLCNSAQNEDLFAQIKNSYANGVTDEFIEPISLSTSGGIEDGDTIFLLNFRADRMRQLTSLLINCNKNLHLYSMTEYSEEFGSVKVLYPKQVIENNLSSVISSANLTQLKVAEQSKYAHVTYFLNGGIETPYKNEDRILVDMADVKTFDLAPKMSAQNVYNAVKSGMQKGYDFICVNFANCDMVGHTGVLDASKVAVQTVTKYAYDLVLDGKKNGYIVVIIADHGNAEIMEENGEPHTAHTNNKVPLIIANAKQDIELKPNGSLCNLMPTILELMGIENK